MRTISLSNRLHKWHALTSLELARTNSLLALGIHTNQQISCTGDSACLLCMFVAAFVHFLRCRHVCVCVCVRACVRACVRVHVM